MLRDTKVTKVAIDATAGRQYGRPGAHEVTIGHYARGTGATLSEARDNAATQLMETLAHSHHRPAFAIDDDGSLIVAVTDGTGTSTYRITRSRAALVGTHNGTPESVINGCPHWIALTDAAPAPAAVSCPCCGDPMLPDMVVCWSCFRWTGNLTPGTYLDHALTCEITSADIAGWSAERDRRNTTTG